MSASKNCRDCKFLGADPDGAYCGHPSVYSWRDMLQHVQRAALDDARRFISLPTIVCLCGSTRFHDEFQKANYQFTMEGKIVLSVGFFVHGLNDEQLVEEMKIASSKAIDGGWDVFDEGYFKELLKATRNAHSENIGCTAEQKEKLDQLHLRKIDLCDEVHVLNKGGYIGSSTQRELAYGIMLDRRISFLEPDEGKAYLEDTVKQHELGAHISRLCEGRINR